MKGGKRTLAIKIDETKPYEYIQVKESSFFWFSCLPALTEDEYRWPTVDGKCMF